MARNSRQNLKLAFCLSGCLALLTIVVERAVALDIKNTNYPIPSNAYFVSPEGKDSNSGQSADSPWPVTKAIDSAPSGATIVFRGGIYRNIEAKLKKQLTLQPFPNEQAWLKGSIKVENWVADDGRWRKDGWQYSFPPDMGKQFIDPDHPLAGYRDMVFMDGVALKQVGSKSAVGPGNFYVDSANNRLYIGDNPAGKTVEATALSYGLSLWKAGSADPSGSIVRGLGFAHYADMGLRLGAPNLTLENNTLAWNGITGAWFWGKMGSAESAASRGAIVRDNTFSYNGRKGLGGDQVDGMLLEGNTISHNNVERFAINWDAAGVKITRSDNVIWRNNLVENNYATGMWVDLSSTNTTIVNNISRYNGSIGIFFEASHEAIVAGNLSYKNDYAGIMVSNSSNARVYNNTLVRNGTNFKVKDTKRNNDNSQEYKAGITWIARNIVFKNNILSNVDGGTFFDASNCSTGESATMTVKAADYNAYYRASSNEPGNTIKWSLDSNECAKEYDVIASFSASTGYEEQAIVIFDTSTNPFFVDEENDDYHLKPDSSVIGRGEALPSDIAAAMGLALGEPVDLGAIQARAIIRQ